MVSTHLKRSLIVFFLFASFMVLSGTSIAQDEVVEIEFVSWMAAEPATAPAIDAILAAFQEAHPNIRVRSTPLPFNESDQLLIRSLGGSPPDVSLTHTNWVGPILEAGLLAPLDDLLLNQEDYYDSALTGIYGEDSRLYTVALAISPTILYYNIDLLNQAGFDEPPQTFEELSEMAYAVHDLDDDIYGIGIDNKELTNAGFYFYGNFIRTFGGDIFGDDGSVVIDSPETIAAYEYIQQLWQDGVAPTGLERRELRELFAQGRIGFYLDNPDGIVINETFSGGAMVYGENFDIAPFPSDVAGEPGPTFFVEKQMAIYEASQHKEEAALLIDFMTSAEGIQILNDLNANHTPVRSSAEEAEYFTNNPDVRDISVVYDAVQNASSLPGQGSTFPAVMQAIARAGVRVGALQEEPADVVAILQTEIEEVLAE